MTKLIDNNLFVLCDDQKEAEHIASKVEGGQAVKEWHHCRCGSCDPEEIHGVLCADLTSAEKAETLLDRMNLPK